MTRNERIAKIKKLQDEAWEIHQEMLKLQEELDTKARVLGGYELQIESLKDCDDD